MQHITNVHSDNYPQTIQFINDNVLIPSNIHTYNSIIDEYEFNGYEYDCDIYNKNEYFIIMAEQAQHITQLEDELAAAKILLGVDE